VTIANVLTGLGTALTPLFVGSLVSKGLWPVWPAVLIAAFACTFGVSVGWNAVDRATIRRPTRALFSRGLILFGSAALLYAFCEGAFSSWATTFAQHDRHFSLAAGEAALSGFWFALTGSRLLAAFATRLLRPRRAFVIFPIAIGAAFLLLPVWPTPALLVAGFVAGGVACSIVFPYAMSLALATMPGDKDRVAAVLVGALMAGEGLGTFTIGIVRTEGGLPLTEIYRCSSLVAFALAIVAAVAVRAGPASAVKSSR
jgi:fucose permease